MGSYSGFLLLEDMLDNLTDDSRLLFNEASQLFNPSVEIVEEDCGTLLGRRVQIDSSAIGLKDLATDEYLTSEDVEFFLSQGLYHRQVRHTAFCTSNGGVCKKCYEATYRNVGSVPVGSRQIATTEITVGTQMFLLQDGGVEVLVSADGEPVSRVDVFLNDVYTEEYEETLPDFDQVRIIFPEVPPNGSKVFVRIYRETSSPFMGYLSKTYSGNLLGAAPMDTGILPIRKGLLKERISEGRLAALEVELENYSQNIPASYLGYLANIKDPLEKELFILSLYGVFYDVGV